MANPSNWDWLSKARKAFTPGYMLRGVKIDEHIVNRSFVRDNRAKGTVLTVDSQAVMAAAQNMEAALSLTENAPDSTPVLIELSHRELAHFVAYVRTLDSDYRAISDKLTALQERFGDNNGSKAVQALAQAIKKNGAGAAEGKPAAQPGTWQRERQQNSDGSENPEGHVSMAQKQSLAARVDRLLERFHHGR